MEFLSHGGMLLVVVQEAAYVSGGLELRNGDLSMIYSAGITESANGDGEEFGYARLEAQLKERTSWAY